MKEVARFQTKPQGEAAMQMLETAGIVSTLRHYQSDIFDREYFALNVEESDEKKAQQLILIPLAKKPLSTEQERVRTEIEEKMLANYKCVKCAHTQAQFRRIATTGIGFSKVFDIQYNTFIAISCAKCGYSEFFDADILGESHVLGTVLDVLFG